MQIRPDIFLGGKALIATGADHLTGLYLFLWQKIFL